MPRLRGRWSALITLGAVALTAAAGARAQDLVPVPADYLAAGKAQPTVFRASTREWLIYAPTGGILAVPFGEAGDQPVPGDYFGRGRAQLAVFRPATGEWLIRADDGSAVRVAFGGANTRPVPADFLGVRRTQMDTFRADTAQWSLRRDDGSSLAIQWGAAGDLPVAADYFGLRRAQLAVYRPATAEWFLRDDLGRATRIPFGQPGGADVPVPADYLGLGRDQLAVFRPAGAEWFLRPDTGSALRIQWGAAGDLPVPADYAGLRRTQIAVFRPGTGEWLLRGDNGQATRIPPPGGGGTGGGPNATVPGELLVDTPTLQSLALRWPITGDDNGNATVAVAYRRQGDTAWRPALPMLRVNREVVDRDGTPFRCGNLFAGSVLTLQPDTTYEVRCTLADPEGGQQERTATVRTRAVPPTLAGDRQMHLYPPGYTGTRQTPGFADLATAARQARPGDVVLLHAGTYAGTFSFPISGTAAKPIVFRAAGDGEVVVDGQGADANILDAQGGHHFLWFEGLTIRNGRTGIKGNSSNGLLVRRCRIENVQYGVITYTADTNDWYLADNVITGRITNWYPRVEGGDTGIILAGSGHVICYNRVSHFWDCISTAGAAVDPAWASQLHPPQTAIDIYNNDCSEALDDGIEADESLHNVRVFNNRITNVHVGLSAQPALGGPLYFIGNCVYNTTQGPLKLHNYPSGLFILQNTLVSAGQGFESWPPAWQNATLRNNLFLGARGYAMETGSPHPRTSLDYNGYRKVDPTYVLKWSPDGGTNWGRYATLADFSRATGHEAHGVAVDFGIFLRAAAPVEGRTYTQSELDLRLAVGSAAVDAGAVLPTVNDDFAGRAPDLGCIEQGKAVPVYGPRP